MQFWAHPGIDMHFITHPETIEEVERIAGPGQRPLGQAADLAGVPGRALARRTRGARSACRPTTRR